MKKLIFAFAAFVAVTTAVSFVSCDGKTIAALDSLSAVLDSIDTLSIDTAGVDTINVDTFVVDSASL